MGSMSTVFKPYTYPRPNMAVQAGTAVKIVGLQSPAGQALNGRTGVAQHCLVGPDGEFRWSVAIDIDGDGEEVTSKSISIRNLRYDMSRKSLYILFHGRTDPSIPSPDLVACGTMYDDEPAVMVFDFPTRPRFDIAPDIEAGNVRA